MSAPQVARFEKLYGRPATTEEAALIGEYPKVRGVLTDDVGRWMPVIFFLTLSQVAKLQPSQVSVVFYPARCDKALRGWLREFLAKYKARMGGDSTDLKKLMTYVGISYRPPLESPGDCWVAVGYRAADPIPTWVLDGCKKEP